ncbi:tyrosine-type recombinase/integrase [Shewanella acanthi]|uniref:tyrosine-type recombinase/integrase n=1 Tax=Shewanella acanthi TaxID=2864212 RepID=UPI001C65F283|nr:tyrosine-type recombinase/integrase [Shewanella acanthi]QYJ80601.1 tyrosine-type recombinase/integrase [Shewanella acanthi]
MSLYPHTQSKQHGENVYFEEAKLPLSIQGDFLTAAAETQYEISANTRRVYKSSFNQFCQYCSAHGLQALPADPRSIISFIGYQKELIQVKNGVQLSKQTLTSRLAAIRYHHIQAGFPSPTEHPLVLRVMKGLSRNQQRLVQDYDQQPIMYDEMAMLLEAIERQPHPLTRARDKAIIQLGMQGGFRRSELANLKVQHLSFMRDKLKVRLPFSKSNQQGAKEWKSLPDTEPYAAYEAVKEWLSESQINQGHLFRSLSRDGKSLRPYKVAQWELHHKMTLQTNSGFLNGDDIYRIIKKYCTLAGLPAHFYGAHSLRSGCVTQLHENNRDHLYIMARTGHSDPRSLRHYLKPRED